MIIVFVALALANLIHVAHEVGMLDIKKGSTKAVVVIGFLLAAIGHLGEAAVHFFEGWTPQINIAESISHLLQYFP